MNLPNPEIIGRLPDGSDVYADGAVGPSQTDIDDSKDPSEASFFTRNRVIGGAITFFGGLIATACGSQASNVNTVSPTRTVEVSPSATSEPTSTARATATAIAIGGDKPLPDAEMEAIAKQVREGTATEDRILLLNEYKRSVNAQIEAQIAAEKARAQTPTAPATATAPATSPSKESTFNPPACVPFGGEINGFGYMLAIRFNGNQAGIKDGLLIAVFKHGAPNAAEGTKESFISLEGIDKITGPYKFTSIVKGSLFEITATSPDSKTMTGTFIDGALGSKGKDPYTLNILEGSLQGYANNYDRISKQEFHIGVSPDETIKRLSRYACK